MIFGPVKPILETDVRNRYQAYFGIISKIKYCLQKTKYQPGNKIWDYRNLSLRLQKNNNKKQQKLKMEPQDSECMHKL